MVSNVYLSKYKVTDPRLPKRLFTRGLKLLAIFLALNLARTYIVPLLGTGVVSQSLLDVKGLFTVFISGNCRSGWQAHIFLDSRAHQLLVDALRGVNVPISILQTHISYRMCIPLDVRLALELTGAESTNLELVTIGMLGVLAGFMPIAAINNFVHHRYVLGLAYLCYIIAITIWNVPFSSSTDWGTPKPNGDLFGGN